MGVAPPFSGRNVFVTASTPEPAEPLTVSRSPRMQTIFEFLRIVRNSDSTVLITGASGTGKEVVARLIHGASRRAHHPFVAVSCALFSETLIESELFGHERGAFTDALRDKAGRFELATEGTLFLDDIDDVPLSMQVKLLRALQTHTIERLGATTAVPVNVRVIAASKHDLRTMVAAGTFREDLYYRLNVLRINLPPLRERREDIEMLTRHFLARGFLKRGETPPAISDAVRQAFLSYPWPGNVRELENVCERVAQTCSCGTFRTGCVAPSILMYARADDPDALTPILESGRPMRICLDDLLRQREAAWIAEALRQTGGNKSRAADLLKIKRSTLGDRMARCGLQTANEPTARAPAGATLAAARSGRH
jgi:DNA-binding NtrC family response regulator